MARVGEDEVEGEGEGVHRIVIGWQSGGNQVAFGLQSGDSQVATR